MGLQSPTVPDLLSYWSFVHPVHSLTRTGLLQSVDGGVGRTKSRVWITKSETIRSQLLLVTVTTPKRCGVR